MTQDGATRSRRLSVLALTTIVFASLALNAILLWRWPGKAEQADSAPRVSAPEAQQPAAPPRSRPLVKPQEAEGTREGGQGEAPSPQLSAGRRAAPGADDSFRARTPERTSPETVGLQAKGASAPDAVVLPGRSAPVTADAAPAQGFSNAPPDAADAGARGPAAPPSGPQTVRAIPSQSGAAPQETGPVSPLESTAAQEAEDQPPGEDTTGEPTGFVEIEPGSDRTPPLLDAVRFNPKVVQAGGVTTLTVYARDDLSGVKSFRGDIRSPSGLATLRFESLDTGGGAVPIQITLPQEAEAGIWHVSSITIIDGADNSTRVNAPSAAEAPPEGTLTVNSPKSDSTAPEVLQIWFDKPTVGGGEKNMIRIEARDDRSGVASIKVACQSPSRSALIWLDCALNADSGIWEGMITVPGNADCGEWAVQRLEVKDKAGNTTLVSGGSPLLALANFQVSSGGYCDFTPPTLDAFDLYPTFVSNETATEILVTATVHDDGSGVSTLMGQFKGPVSTGGSAPLNTFHCSPDPGDPEVTWICKVKVPQFAARGTWTVHIIHLEDKARNNRVYTFSDPVVSGGVFEVQ